MSKGKFSNPRPHKEEDRQIEQAFRQVTGASPPPPKPEPGEFDLFPETEEPFSEETTVDEPTFSDRVLDFCGKAMELCSRNKKIVLAAVCGMALILIVGITGIFFAGSSDPYGRKILNNVLIAGVNVGGMTKNEAIEAVEKATGQRYAQEYLVIDLDGTTLRLAPGDVNAKLDVKAVVNAAYDYGRTGTKAEQEKAYQASLSGNHIIGLLPYLKLNETYIRDVLQSYADEAGSALTQASYVLEGDMPELATDKFDETAPCQTLVITMGTPGVSFDVDAVYQKVLDAYSLYEFLVTVEDVSPISEPAAVDLEAISQAVCVDPVDATVDMQNYKTIPGAYGYGFDMEAAQKRIDKAGYGEEVRIPMEYIEPEILDGDVFFRDVLGQCQTSHTNNENRNTNLRLACQALNGLVLDPGETFSFNETLGKRTAEKGYKSAPAYSGDELVDSLGGGICQVSSTLYYCTLLADLETVSRVNHGFPVSYIDYGMDATVSWGTPDFKFKNSSNFPIKLQAEVSDGYVKIQILGTDQRDYYIKMEYKITNTYNPDTEYVDFEANNAEGYQDGDVIQKGTTGYYVKTYKLKYDKQTDTLISREFETNSQYKTVKRIVARVAAPEETTEPTQVPTQPPADTTPPETVPPETAPPTDPTQPPTEAPTVPPETTPQTDPPVEAPVEPITPADEPEAA